MTEKDRKIKEPGGDRRTCRRMDFVAFWMIGNDRCFAVILVAFPICLGTSNNHLQPAQEKKSLAQTVSQSPKQAPG